MESGEKYWSVLDPIWDAINIDAADTFARTFASVPRCVGLLYAAHFCQSEICNGGFTQFFWNSTGVLAPEAVDGFMAIGQPRVANVVQRAMSMLGALELEFYSLLASEAGGFENAADAYASGISG